MQISLNFLNSTQESVKKFEELPKIDNSPDNFVKEEQKPIKLSPVKKIPIMKFFLNKIKKDLPILFQHLVKKSKLDLKSEIKIKAIIKKSEEIQYESEASEKLEFDFNAKNFVFKSEFKFDINPKKLNANPKPEFSDFFSHKYTFGSFKIIKEKIKGFKIKVGGFVTNHYGVTNLFHMKNTNIKEHLSLAEKYSGNNGELLKDHLFQLIFPIKGVSIHFMANLSSLKTNDQKIEYNHITTAIHYSGKKSNIFAILPLTQYQDNKWRKPSISVGFIYDSFFLTEIGRNDDKTFLKLYFTLLNIALGSFNFNKEKIDLINKIFNLDLKLKSALGTKDTNEIEFAISLIDFFKIKFLIDLSESKLVIELAVTAKHDLKKTLQNSFDNGMKVMGKSVPQPIAIASSLMET